MITIRELIKFLEAIENQKRVVVLSGDEEGNSYRTLEMRNLCTYAFCLETNEVGLEELTLELRDEGYSEEDVLDNGVPALVLY